MKTNKTENEYLVCPVCATKLSEKTKTVLEEKDDVSLIHTTCKECKCNALLMLNAHPIYDAVEGIATELSKQDIKKLQKAKPIESNEILAFYKYLKEDKMIMGSEKKKAAKGQKSKTTK